MRAFVTVPLFLSIVCVLALGASLFIGRSHPPPERIVSLHLVDCSLPCWNDITPGVSLFVDAMKHFKSTFPNFIATSPDFPFYGWQYDNVAQNDTYFSFEIDNSYLAAEVMIQTNSTSPITVLPSFGEMLMVYGTPTCVVLNRQTGNTVLHYENSDHKSILEFTVSQPSPSDPVTTIIYGGDNKFSCQLGTITWRAFRRTQPAFYLTAPVGAF